MSALLCISCRATPVVGRALQCEPCLTGGRDSTPNVPAQPAIATDRPRGGLPATAAPDERTATEPTAAGELEATAQERVRQALIGAGFRVHRVGQRNARGTQDAGVPDLWVTHRAARLAAWIEMKRPGGGTLSAAQREFREDCLVVGVRHYVARTVHDVRELLDDAARAVAGRA